MIFVAGWCLSRWRFTIFEVAAVRAEDQVEQVARQRHRADRRIEGEIARHSHQLPFRQAEIARFPDQIGAHHRGEHVAERPG